MRRTDAGPRLRGLPARELPGGLTVWLADRWGARGRGLAGLEDLDAAHGLELRPCRAVHTFGMHFALDLVWLDRAGRVLRVTRDVRPRRHAGCLRARSVVEVRAGEGERFAVALAS